MAIMITPLHGLNPKMAALTSGVAWTLAIIILVLGIVYMYVYDGGSREYDIGRDLTSNGVLFFFIASILSMVLYAGDVSVGGAPASGASH